MKETIKLEVSVEIGYDSKTERRKQIFIAKKLVLASRVLSCNSVIPKKAKLIK